MNKETSRGKVPSPSPSSSPLTWGVMNLDALRKKSWYRVRAKVKNLRAAPTMPPTYIVMQAALKHVQSLYEGMAHLDPPLDTPNGLCGIIETLGMPGE